MAAPPPLSPQSAQLPLVLASSSPQRRSLLQAAGIPFEPVAPDVDEQVADGIAAAAAVVLVAERKVRRAAELLVRRAGRDAAARLVLGADTVVVLGSEPFGKPADEAAARNMLSRLHGTVHQVLTGVVLLTPSGSLASVAVATDVKLRALLPEELDWYIATGEWRGAAGGYRIQQRAAMLVEWLQGSYSNVVGLPLEAVYDMLKQHGYPFSVV